VWEAQMAKGQMRSNKEAKKPKKDAAAKPKATAATSFPQAELSVTKGKPKKA
jgi:hypothetical protein